MVWILAINAQEISALIKQQIENFQPNFDVTETGSSLYWWWNRACSWSDKAMSGELLIFEMALWRSGAKSRVDRCGDYHLGRLTDIREGDTICRTGKIMEVPVEMPWLGGLLIRWGVLLMGLVTLSRTRHVRLKHRLRVSCSVSQYLNLADRSQGNWCLGSDWPWPAGAGIIGDRQTGKTTIAIDAILNQKGQDMICIWRGDWSEKNPQSVRR